VTAGTRGGLVALLREMHALKQQGERWFEPGLNSVRFAAYTAVKDGVLDYGDLVDSIVDGLRASGKVGDAWTEPEARTQVAYEFSRAKSSAELQEIEAMKLSGAGRMDIASLRLTEPQRQVLRALAVRTGWSLQHDPVEFASRYATDLTGVDDVTAWRALKRLERLGLVERGPNVWNHGGRRAIHTFKLTRVGRVVARGVAPNERLAAREFFIEWTKHPIRGEPMPEMASWFHQQWCRAQETGDGEDALSRLIRKRASARTVVTA
jgi:DNA-binding MarR family transcriptional regulator